MKKMKIIGLALGVLALIAVAQPANAACGAPFLITSLNQAAGYYAYIINPTVTPGGGGNGLAGSTITDQFTGFFWGVGVGDPALGVGADNGAFAALSWMYIYPNYPAGVLTTWAASADIDTCIDAMGPLGERCQVTFLQDIDADPESETFGTGLFAIISTPDDPASGDFFMDNGGENIVMAPADQMAILGSARAGDTGVEIMLSGPSMPEAGLYLSDVPQCQGAGTGGLANGLIVGYTATTQVVPRGSAPPSDFSREAWVDAGASTPVGQPTTVSVPCDGDSDVYVSYAWDMDSGFSAPIVSRSTTRIECGPNVAEPGEGIRVKPEGRTRGSRTRQR